MLLQLVKLLFIISVKLCSISSSCQPCWYNPINRKSLFTVVTILSDSVLHVYNIHLCSVSVVTNQRCSGSSHRGVHSVVCRLLCSYLRPGHRRPPQWQHHGPQHWTGSADLYVSIPPAVSVPVELTVWSSVFALSCSTSTLVTFWEISSPNLGSRGSAYRLSSRTTSSTSSSRARPDTPKNLAGLYLCASESSASGESESVLELFCHLKVIIAVKLLHWICLFDKHYVLWFHWFTVTGVVTTFLDF